MSMPPKLALVATIFDEVESMTYTLQRLGPRFERLEVVQSQEAPYAPLAEALARHPAGTYHCLPNLDTRTPEEKAANAERFDIGARSMARNYSRGFAALVGADVEYVVGITGDTLLLHPYGLWALIAAMGAADIAVSRAMGQEFHRADLTREEMADKNHPKGGRLQDASVKDFMPHLFIARAALCARLAHIAVTNPWCFEQCLGDAIGDATQYVFSDTAYGFADGVIYNAPSPTNWKHKA